MTQYCATPFHDSMPKSDCFVSIYSQSVPLEVNTTKKTQNQNDRNPDKFQK